MFFYYFHKSAFFNVSYSWGQRFLHLRNLGNQMFTMTVENFIETSHWKLLISDIRPRLTSTAAAHRLGSTEIEEPWWRWLIGNDDTGVKEKVRISGGRSFQRRSAVMDMARFESMRWQVTGVEKDWDRRTAWRTDLLDGWSTAGSCKLATWLWNGFVLGFLASGVIWG